MKDNKSFFNNNNRLNKGYSKSDNKVPDHRFHRKKLEHVLPPIDLMEEYENIYPGTIAKMIAMAEKEQEHRHKRDMQGVLVYTKNVRTARISNMIFLMIIALVTGLLARENYYVASIFAISLFLTISIGIFFISFNRRDRNRR